jgi:hypothetical protein
VTAQPVYGGTGSVRRSRKLVPRIPTTPEDLPGAPDAESVPALGILVGWRADGCRHVRCQNMPPRRPPWLPSKNGMLP